MVQEAGSRPVSYLDHDLGNQLLSAAMDGDLDAVRALVGPEGTPVRYQDLDEVNTLSVWWVCVLMMLTESGLETECIDVRLS